MTKRPLVFERLEIRRMPGFTREGFTLEGLSPGINIIYGPNGSGKTTTAKAIHALLWSDAAGGDERLFARIKVGDEAWTGELDYGKPTWQKEGIPQTTPDFAPAQDKDRYMLDLVQLLQADDQNFAQTITRESLGGYDIERAGQAAGLNQTLQGVRSIPESLKNARQHLNAVVDEQEHLTEQAAELIELRNRLEEATRALSQLKVIEAIRNVKSALNDGEQCEKAVEAYPSWMKQLRGDEDEELDHIQADIEHYQQLMQHARDRIDEARQRQDKTNLPDGGLSPTTIKSLNNQVNAMIHLEDKLLDIEREVVAAKEAWERSGISLLTEEGATSMAKGLSIAGDTQWAITPIDLAALNLLEELAENVNGIHARINDLETQKRRLEKDLVDFQAAHHGSDGSALGVDGGTGSGDNDDRVDNNDVRGGLWDTDALRQGMQLLIGWTKANATHAHEENDKGKNVFQGLSVALGWLVATVAAILLSVREHVAFAILVALSFVGLAGTVFQWSKANKGSHDIDAQRKAKEAHHIEAYTSLNLPAPTSWEKNDVLSLFDRLQRYWFEAEKRQRLQEDLKRTTGDLEHAQHRLDELDREREHLAAKYGLPTKERANQLWWLASHIFEWQQKKIEYDKALASYRSTQQSIIRSYDKFLHDLADAGYDQGDFPERKDGGSRFTAELEAVFSALKERHETWHVAADTILAATREMERAQDALAKAGMRRRHIFERLGLETEHDEVQEAVVREACRQLEAFQKAKDSLKEALVTKAIRLDELYELLPETDRPFDPLSTKVDGRPFYEWTDTVLFEAEAAAKVKAERHEELSREIDLIEFRIEQSKQKNDLEEALAKKQNAEEALYDLLEREGRMEIGRLLLEHVRQKTSEVERPEVFIRARELFAGITRGAYELVIDDGDQPLFRAIDTATGEGKSLEELSGGTRAQVLLAVRIAFVEAMEATVKLPIIFDEALANSDDDRAEAIITAVLQLAATGRQVFYMTAQADEVYKWKRVLENESNLSYTLVELDQVRRLERVGGGLLSGFGTAVLPDAASIMGRDIPSPKEVGEGFDAYIRYGDLLKVPPVDVDAGHTGGVHLWYLLDDADVLYRFLLLSVETWGSLKALHGHGLLEQAGRWATNAYAKARAANRCLEEMIDAWKVGRGRPINRTVLAQSGAVSNTFIDQAAELAAALDDDAKAFMKALDAGKLKRFRNDNKEQLRAYLKEHGYIDDRDVLDESLAVAQTKMSVVEPLEAGIITAEHIERLITAVFHASGR